MNRFSAAVIPLFVIAACVSNVIPARAVVVSVGHRGNSSVAPENTLSAIEAAYGKAWGVEYDTRITNDGHIILMHDASVNRTTTGYGNVEDLSFSYIRSLDAGIKLFPEYAGEQVPTLSEALSTAAAGNLVSCVEVKTGSATDYLSELLPYQSQIEVHCFNWNFLSSLNSLDSGFTLVALGGGDLAAQLSSMPACVNKISWGYSGLTASNIAAAHAAGKQVYAWTVDNANTMLALEAMGVDGIVTNAPALATQVLNKQTDPTAGMPYELHDGLMMNWSFDDALGGGAPTTVADSVNGVNATLSPTVAVPESWQVAPNAKLGGALKFDGVDDYVSVPVNTATIPTRNAVTISTWVKLDKLPSEISGSYGSIYDSDQDGYVLYLDEGSNEIRMKVTAGASARPGIPGAQLDTTQWHLVTGVYDGGAGVARIYLDGNLMDVHADDGSGSDGLVGYIGQQTAFFGRNGTDANGFFEGKIDETAVWERPLSQAEIAHLYNGGLGRSIQQTNPVIESIAPVVRLEFEGNLNNLGTGGSAYNGQWIDGLSGYATYESGIRDQALHLHNPLPHGTGGDAVAVPVTLGDAGTISFWCKPDSFYNYQTLFDNVSSDSGDWEMWIYSSGQARFRLTDGSMVTFDLNTLGGADNWYHMAVTWFKAGSDVVLNLYVDGLVRDIGEGPWVDPGSEFHIGGGNTNNDFCNAAFDDFRIYDTMLTSDEILAIFAQREAALLPYIPGDANRDGVVDEEDANRVATYWGQSDAEWWMGDFDGDGHVGPSDASIMAANWGYDSSESTSDVPEPTITIFVITALFALGVMSRKQRT